MTEMIYNMFVYFVQDDRNYPAESEDFQENIQNLQGPVPKGVSR